MKDSLCNVQTSPLVHIMIGAVVIEYLVEAESSIIG